MTSHDFYIKVAEELGLMCNTKDVPSFEAVLRKLKEERCEYNILTTNLLKENIILQNKLNTSHSNGKYQMLKQHLTEQKHINDQLLRENRELHSKLEKKCEENKIDNTLSYDRYQELKEQLEELKQFNSQIVAENKTLCNNLQNKSVQYELAKAFIQQLIEERK
jgi:hypothetical protein